LLVRELPAGPEEQVEAEGSVRYYIVPFGQRHEVDEMGEPLAHFSILW